LLLWQRDAEVQLELAGTEPRRDSFQVKVSVKHVTLDGYIMDLAVSAARR
jgi:hypothetical protein